MGQRKTLLSYVEPWLQWNIVTGISLALALAVLPVIVNLSLLVLPLPFSLLAGSAVCGAMLGLAQWFFLHLHVTSLTRWSIASGLGGATAAFLMVSLLQLQTVLVDRIIGGTLAGLLLGGLQSVVLSLPGQRRGWIVSAILGWLGAAVIAVMFFANLDMAPANAPFEVVRSLAAGWVFLSLVLLFALIVLFPKPDERQFDGPVRWLPW